MQNTFRSSFLRISCALFFITIFSAYPAPEVGYIALDINDVSGYENLWPLVGGVPFPEGELRDVSKMRLTFEGRVIPCQFDVAARWQDGSIRWVIAGFTGSPRGRYVVEYGEGIRNLSDSRPLQVIENPGGNITVDTGAAIYRFTGNNMLPEEAWLVSRGRRVQFLDNSGDGAYLVDNRGRKARVAGPEAEIENKITKEGPGRVVLKRSGWYVTDEGEKVARTEMWIYLGVGSPFAKITHSLFFTEDTNEVWYSDYGLAFGTPDRPSAVYCAVGETGREVVKEVSAGENETYLLQDTFPHFAERDYRGIIGTDGIVIHEFPAAGDWAHADYGEYGITIVMPWLAERFPKEISFGRGGAKAVFWSGKSGRELDFRGQTLVEEYWQSWAEKGPGSPGKEFLSNWESNAQGAARTHDIWLLPHAGAYDPDTVLNAARAGSRQPLVLADTKWLCSTEAMGYPMLHKDTERFPVEEAVISEYFERFILPLKAFPLNGFISWGDFPTWTYQSIGGRIMAQFHILTNIDRYGARREPWRLYARSGDRTYYDYAHRFGRFSGDWYLIHDDSKSLPSRRRGSFISFLGQAGRLPFSWGNAGHLYVINGGDIGNWMMEYYLTGDEKSLELLKTVKESFRKHWRVEGAIPVNQSKVLRVLVTLSMMEWDEDASKMARDVAHSMFDLESQNAIKMFSASYGPMYKDHRTSHNTLEYFLETGDELAKEAFLKLIEHRYRFDRRTAFATYKNYDGFTYALAYWMTGDERYRRVVEQAVRDAVRYMQEHPLPDTLARLPENPLDWPRLPDYLGIWEWHNPFIGLPTALKLIAEKGWSGGTTPLAVKPMRMPEAGILFRHVEGSETVLNMYIETDKGIAPEIPQAKLYGEEVQTVAVETVFEKRMARGPFFERNPEAYPEDNDHYNAVITVPAETPEGLYVIYPGRDTTFTLLDSNSATAALYCPEGFWSTSMGQHSGSMPYGRSGEGMPVFFHVPEGLEELELFVGFRGRVVRADGSAEEISDENNGRIAVPVEGAHGTWSIEPYIHNMKGLCMPSFFRLLNVEPVVAFGAPGLLPEEKGKTVPAPFPDKPVVTDTVEFVQGIEGKAARLSGEATITFGRGARVQEGGYSFFPGGKGTVEFWYRADRSTHEIPVRLFREEITPFLRGPHIFLSYRQMLRALRMPENALRMQVLPAEPVSPAAGYQRSFFFSGGEWTHMAFTWEIREGRETMEGEIKVFIDGKELPFQRMAYGMVPLNTSKIFKLSEEGEDITIGPFEGAIDLLRISDTVRYSENFTPSRKAPEPDGNTRALFLFDGDLKGVSAFSTAPFQAR